MRLTISCCCIVLLAISFSPTVSAQTMTSLFDFDQAGDTAKWQIVNDDVIVG